MAIRQAATPRIGAGVIADQQLATAQHMPEQGVEVTKNHALRRIFVVKLPCCVVPGNIGYGKGFQVGLLLFIAADFANEAEGALGEVEQLAQQVVENLMGGHLRQQLPLTARNRFENVMAAADFAFRLLSFQQRTHPARQHAHELGIGGAEVAAIGLARAEIDGAPALPRDINRCANIGFQPCLLITRMAPVI